MKTHMYNAEPIIPNGQEIIFPFALKITKPILKITARFSILRKLAIKKRKQKFTEGENKKADSETKPALNYALNQETTL